MSAAQLRSASSTVSRVEQFCVRVAKGSADVELIADGDTTLLRYTAKAEIGGKIAQLGSRLITSTARKLSKAFFENFEKIMRGEMPPDGDPPTPTK